ncbi:conserved membrane hypothetical protein [Candidatus Sulfotelmatobacter kueseliae]|uniref:B box-type domain-containing protein n=1 Tax=Candidatus Sulfotelmatobacter kueseliae TaxID=2042962 RepID=A0A2U3LDY7_9BACT|nr:conserved membrane hypothetical protein [Candidatus Sulfotelmatobacter kueseliae]
MNCATHNDVAAVAFCRTCGKPLCQNCTRDVRGVIYCESCLAARMEGTAPAAGFMPVGQTMYPPGPPPMAPAMPSVSSGPNPAVAGILAGFFPFGVGAVYCSQYAKGLAHLLIFAMLIFAANHAGGLDWLFALAIAFFYVYQIIDSVRTARAIQLGQPAPDPMGLAQTFGVGEKFESSKVPAGAVILIGMGILFLLHTTDILEFSGELFIGLVMIFLAGWIFARRWGVFGAASRACACGRCRMRCLMGPAVILTIGVMLLLDSRDIHGVAWDRTWPAILLVIGIVKLLQSTASAQGHIEPLPPAPPSAPPPQPPPAQPQPPASSDVSGEVHNG